MHRHCRPIAHLFHINSSRIFSFISSRCLRVFVSRGSGAFNLCYLCVCGGQVFVKIEQQALKNRACFAVAVVLVFVLVDCPLLPPPPPSNADAHTQFGERDMAPGATNPHVKRFRLLSIAFYIVRCTIWFFSSSFVSFSLISVERRVACCCRIAFQLYARASAYSIELSV